MQPESVRKYMCLRVTKSRSLKAPRKNKRLSGGGEEAGKSESFSPGTWLEILPEDAHSLSAFFLATKAKATDSGVSDFRWGIPFPERERDKDKKQLLIWNF